MEAGGFTKKEFSSLLPPNATSLEKAIEKASYRCTDLEGPISYLWNPGDEQSLNISRHEEIASRCPLSFLPFLAWGLNIEIWNQDWSEKDKRNIIKKYLWIRKIRGTLEALKNAYEALKVKIQVKEWWQPRSEGEGRQDAYYFELKLFTSKNPYLTEENRAAIHWMTDQLKPLRSKYQLHFIYSSEAELGVTLIRRITRICRIEGKLDYAS